MFPTFSTMSRLKRRRVVQCCEVVLIGAIPDIHLHFMLKTRHALLACLPLSSVFFAGMMPAKREPPVISRAAISSVGKEHIVVFIITNPIATTVCLYKFLTCRATQPTNVLGFLVNCMGSCCPMNLWHVVIVAIRRIKCQ